MMFWMSTAKSLSPDCARMALAESESMSLKSSTALPLTAAASAAAAPPTKASMLETNHVASSFTASMKFCTRTTPPSFTSSIAALVPPR